MSYSDCFQVLGVAPNASWEEVRRAYKDLVRVWHPDRFQSDPKLRGKAEQQLQKINEAYEALRNSALSRGQQPETPPPPPPPEQPEPGPTVSVHPRNRSAFDQFLRNATYRWPLRIIVAGAACTATVAIGSVMYSTLHIRTLDEILEQGQARPEILTPTRFMSGTDSGSVSVSALSRWARERVDLWRSSRSTAERPVAPGAAAVNAAPPPAPAAQVRRREAAAAPVMPVNGTEVTWTRRSGAGEVWVTNDTSQDALATLVQAQTAAPQRAVYIQAKKKVCIRNIAPGFYGLYAEIGEDWDAIHLRFRAARKELDPSGPFQCIDVTSTRGTTGCRYEVVLRAR